MVNQRFNKSYFDRYYGKRPVRSLHEVAHLATAVHELATWWGSPIRSVLEVGAGPGDWSNWYRTMQPNVRVTSVDVSEHACAIYGHQRRDIASWSPPKPFDLVICMDVLQYLDDINATRALRNLTKATRTYLYFDALTTFDAKHTVDRDATDLDAHLRSGTWYRQRLSRSFKQAGAGLWVRKTSSVVLHELEHAR
ncbi:MAG: class I SAM-dependent methyltransferase [Ilumatobacteraceae bacterium]